MGVGRREFLRLFGVGAAAMATDWPRAIAIEEDQYVNWDLGIAFQKPNGWVFSYDVNEFRDVSKGQHFDVDDPNRASELLEAAELPLMIVSKEPISADSDSFGPGIGVYLRKLPVQGFTTAGCFSPQCQLGYDIAACSMLLKDYRVTADLTATTVSACEAAEYEASFLFEHTNMEPTPVRVKTLGILQQNTFYAIRMFDSPVRGGEMEFDYTPFVASVRLV